MILYRMLLIIIFHNYFWPWPWPQLAEIGLGLVAKIARPRGFGLVNITGRFTSSFCC